MISSSGQGNGTHPTLPSTKRRNRAAWSIGVAVLAFALVALLITVWRGSHDRPDVAGGRPASTPAAATPSASTSAAKAGSSPTRTAANRTPKSSGGGQSKKAKPSDGVPQSLPRRYQAASVSVPARARKGRLIDYDVRVQKGLKINPKQAATFIATTLNDKRSWTGTGKWRFRQVKSADDAELHAYLVTPKTTDALCAPLRTRGKVSCQNGDKVVLNAERWVGGANSYGNDLTNYRRSLVNHEFGHYLGFGHEKCPGKHKRAPVMMQQTKGLDGCRRNPWPDPTR